MDIKNIQLNEIQPSQFYISQAKIDEIKTWFNPNDLSNFMPVPIIKINEQIIFTDGHTRAFVAFSAGLSEIPLCWDTDDLDLEAYQLCVCACMKREIYTISDLANRILNSNDYLIKWNGWCDVLHEILELQKK